MTWNPGKVTIYAPKAFWADVEREAQRQDRSASQVVQFAWQIAKHRIGRMSGPNDVPVITQ